MFFCATKVAPTFFTSHVVNVRIYRNNIMRISNYSFYIHFGRVVLEVARTVILNILKALFLITVIILTVLFGTGQESRFIYTDF